VKNVDTSSEQSRLPIGPNCRITMHFSIQLANGEVVDSTFVKGRPATFVFGDGNVLPHFEKCLLGLHAGDSRSFVLAAKSAFGDYNPANEHAIPRTQFAVDVSLQPGVVIAFQGASGEELPGVVKQINEQFVLVDFNHPLAGKEVVFAVEVISVER